MEKNNTYEIDVLVQDILKRKYPFDYEGNSLDYKIFSDWDQKLENPFFHLNRILASNDYMALHIVSYIIENMALDFIQKNREKVICIIKQLLVSDSQRIRFHILGEFSSLMKDKKDFIFYIKILSDSSDIVQNHAIALFNNLEEEKIKLLNEFSEEDYFKSFFNNYGDIHLSTHKKNLINKSNIYKKIYITGLYRNGYKKIELFEIMDEYKNTDLIDYIYVYLD